MISHADAGYFKIPKTILDPVARVNVSKLTEYGDFPCTHGDIPLIFSQFYEVNSSLKMFLNEGSSSFLPTGSFSYVAPSMKDADFLTCTDFEFGFSFHAQTHSKRRFIKAVIFFEFHLCLRVPFYKAFPL